MKRPLVLGFCGSPNRGGSSDALLEEFLAGARDAGAVTAKAYAFDLAAEPCNDCSRCERTGKCPVADNMALVYPLISQADVICISSPVYFMGLPAPLKAMIDRAQCIWAARERATSEKNVKNEAIKKGFFISVGAAKYPKLFDGSVASVKAFFLTAGFAYCGELLLRSVETRKDLAKNDALVRTARHKGNELVAAIYAAGRRGAREPGEHDRSRKMRTHE